MQRDGDVYRLVANYGFPAERAQYTAEHPVRPDRGSVTGRAAIEGRCIHIPDVTTDPEYRAAGHQQAGGYRTALGVPLLREGTAIGVFALTRTEMKPFTEKQVELVATFADQAVIAIENARLLNELRQRTADLTELLEQQTATSDVLKVISSTSGELQPVFRAMLENATRLCEANFGILNLYENGKPAPPPCTISRKLSPNFGGARRGSGSVQSTRLRAPPRPSSCSTSPT